MRRFPLRTQLLMLVALAAFVRLWCVTHPTRDRAPEPRAPVDVSVQPVPLGNLLDASATPADAR
ncbi:MAG TPA: hypothetical protein VE549_17590 [Myxococcaceae bacterium]|nr:hypothetical protein [Myxococcaceae bacterium]